MKKIALLLCCCAVVFAAQAKQPKKAKGKKAKTETLQPALPNRVDSMSYAFGIELGTNLVGSIKDIPGGKINLEQVLKGFSAILTEDTTVLMNKDFAQEYFRNYIMEVQEAEAQAQRAKNEKFLTDNGQRAEVVSLPSGLQYEVLVPADGPKPTTDSQVTVHYEGILIDGTKFDSSYDRGEPLTLGLGHVIKGWTEGVQLMSKGAKYKFYIPYQLGYGERGAGGEIPPYATLIFTIELIDFE